MRARAGVPIRLLACVSALGLAACLWTEPAALGGQPAASVELETVAHGFSSGIHSASTPVVRDASEWARLWAEHESVVTGKTDPPAVDFADQIVVGVFLGDKPTGGYDVTIVRAEETSGDVTVYYEETSPAPDMMVAQVVTQPYHLVALRSSATSVRFVKATPQAERE